MNASIEQLRLTDPVGDVSEIVAALPERISDVVKPWALKSPQQLALVDPSGSWTYAQLNDAIRELEAWLIGLGVRPGDRVAIVCENNRIYIAVLLACVSMGAWPALINARLSAREIEQICEHALARVVFYTTKSAPQAVEHAKSRGALDHIIGSLGTFSVSSLRDDVIPEPVDPHPANRIGALIYTSGTTGLPKGVMLTNRNLLFVAAVSAKARSLSPNDRLYGALPMSHAVGLSVVLLGSLLSGATVFLTPRFDPVKALAVLKNDKLTILLGSPSMFSLLLDYANLKGIQKLDFPDLRIISSSGALLQQSVKNETEKLFGLTLHNGYGVTECSPNIAMTRVDMPRRDVSVGRVFPGTEVKLVTSDSQTAAPGEVGELRVRGPNVMKGYYRNPTETADAIDSEGWFNTRDLARMDGDHLLIVGRSKELIVRFGLNVYPAEIEAVLNVHPEIARSAVVGRTVGATEGGEEVVAFVQPSPGASLTEAEVAEYATAQLAPYKRPSHILLVDTMPLTPTGKVMKEQLSQMLSVAGK
jgi:long-chain acyl-CoA synthetase